MNPHVEVEIARRYLVENWQSFSRVPGNIWGVARYTSKSVGGDTNFSPVFWNTIPTRILIASPHLQGYDVPGAEIDKLKAEGLTLLEALERLGM